MADSYVCFDDDPKLDTFFVRAKSDTFEQFLISTGDVKKSAKSATGGTQSGSPDYAPISQGSTAFSRRTLLHGRHKLGERTGHCQWYEDEDATLDRLDNASL
jgi:hypothetical protein